MVKQCGVSVVIPTYNCARYIAAAVESVLCQTRAPDELIVVDDGSTDDTRRVLEPYRSRIRYLYQENRGEPAARNAGIRAASCEFVAFLDADDLWVSEKLALQMNYFDRHPECGLVYSDMQIFDRSGVVHASVKQWLGMQLPTGRVFPQLFKETLFGSGTVVCRKECFEKAGCFDETFTVGCDYEMWLRLARNYEFGCVDKPLLLYRQHPEMATHGKGKVLPGGVPWEARAVLSILELHPEIVGELGQTAIRHRLARPYFYLGCAALETGEHRQARVLLRQAIRRWPGNPRYLTLYLASCLTPVQLVKTRNIYHRVFRFAARLRGRNRGASQGVSGSAAIGTTERNLDGSRSFAALDKP